MPAETSIVLLLRDQSPTPDPYEAVFTSFSPTRYQPYTIPVLETSLVNSEELMRVIAFGPIQGRYDGVIITSKRACEAWIHAIKNVISRTATALDDPERHPLFAWFSVPFYVVGKSTASALRQIEALCPDVPPHLPSDGSRGLRIRGEGCGSGEQLAHFILDDFKSKAHHKSIKLLYLTGDKNRDTIPRIIASSSLESGTTGGTERPPIELDALQVYATQGAASFGPKLDELMYKTHGEGTTKDWWIVYFAPSSASFTQPFLRKYFDISSHSDSHPSVNKVTPRIAAIGRTTASFVADELGTRVNAIAHKPTPQDLLAAINEVSGY